MTDPREQLDQLTLLEQLALLSGRNTWQTRQVPRLGIRSVFFADGPHGLRKQVGSADHLGLNASQPATCFPTAATLANSWDTELLRRVGQALGREAACQDVDVLLGPALNLKRDPRCGRNFEYFSEDPVLAGDLAAAYVDGVQSAGVAACPKHFAVNSQELRRMASDSVVDERTMRELYLTAFEKVVREAAPRTIMSAYNRINGTYAHEHRHLLSDVLRDEWGFDGLVVTDWGGGNDPVRALQAGGTLEMPSPGLDSVQTLLDAHGSGELDTAALRDRAAEVLRLAADSDRPRSTTPVDVEAHHHLAREAAARSIVLLRNQDDLLPLAPGTRVAVIGDLAFEPRYQGAGSSLVNPTRVTTPLQALQDSELEVVAAERGYRRHGGPDRALLEAATAAAQRADVVLLHLGLDESSESEGLDREHLRLAGNQVQLLDAIAEVSPNVVVLLAAGAPIEMPWIDNTRALVHGYLPGQAGAEAMTDVLTGAVDPSGRLAETYPLRLSDLPTAATYPADGPRAEYREGPFVGYRYADTADIEVRFPFGFGLSYSRIELGDLRISADGARLRATNVSDRAGSEVVQMYVARAGSSLVRPEQELKGFARVDLPAGATTEILIPFDRYTFRHFDAADGTWRVEGGAAEIRVGTHSRDQQLTGTFEVDGEVLPPVPDAQSDPLAAYRSADVHTVTDRAFEALLGRTALTGRDRAAADTMAGTTRSRARRVLGANDAVRDMADAHSPLARAIAAMMGALVERGTRAGVPSLNLLFTYNMPFRAMAKMTGGAISTPMVEALLTVINGHHLRGLRDVAGATCRTVREGRSLGARLAAVPTREPGRAAGRERPPTPSAGRSRYVATAESDRDGQDERDEEWR